MMVKPIRKNVEGRTSRTVWSFMKLGEEGMPISIPSAEEFSVQVVGDFAGATVIFEGSLEEIADKWFTLTDRQDNEISLSFEGGASLCNLVGWLRPRILGGDETTNLTVILFDRRV